jgi:predicted O-linked N-acetylglucosamine transferase (SPINDLY family)
MAEQSQHLHGAIRHHREGRLAEAEAGYRRVLDTDPDNSDALHLLGLVRYQRNDRAGAVRFIQQAIDRNALDASYHSNLGRILGELGRGSEAIACCRRALALQPELADAHNNLGTLLATAGNWTEAIEAYHHALRQMPGNVEVLNNLAAAYRRSGKPRESIEFSRQALRLSPANPDALLALAADARERGDLEGAAELCHRALAASPANAKAQLELGGILRRQGLWKEAIAAYRTAIANGADTAESNYNLAAALEMRNRLDEARTGYRCALQLDPDFVQAELGLVHVCQHMCDWEELDRRIHRLRSRLDQPVLPALSPFAFLSLPGVSAAQQRRVAERWAQDRFRPPADSRRGGPRPAGQWLDDRIRLGYLSADFHDHATAYLLAEAIELHDRRRFHVTAYSHGLDKSGDMRRRLTMAFDEFVDMQTMSFSDSAQRIERDGIDILIDLKGYTQNTRSDILAFRPAPVQVNFLGYPGTMGADFIDYLVTDGFVTPPESARHYSEALAYLPDCYQPNDRKRPIGARPRRSECGLPDTGVVFCCMNRTYKINAPVFDPWCRLLAEVDGSVLWLHKSNRWADENLRREAAARGLEPERLVFAEKQSLARHLGRLQLADLFLDTLPYNAHTTASDALWCGVPVITCAGETFAARVAGSLLSALDLGELITDNLEDYFRLALRLAREPAALAAVKSKLARNRPTAPLFDTPRYVRNLESLFAEMHRRRLAGEPPSTIRL